MDKQHSRIGIIGVGLMGHGIASNIQNNGYRIGFVEHPGNQPVADLLEKGAVSYPSPARLAGESDVIIVCVTGSPQVEQVVFGEQGVLQGIEPGAVVIDCSTAIPESTLKVYQALHEAGAKFIDAPMTRTPREAAAGRLNLIVGGEHELFESLRPLLGCFAENMTLAGPVGSGHRMKLLHNYVSLGFSAVLAEASVSARRAGIEDRVFVEVLAAGGGAGVILDRLAPYIRQADDSAFRFSLANAAKDMSYYLEMAQHLDAHFGIARSIRDVYTSARDNLPEQTPVPRLIDYLAQ